jgi:DNA-binding response OmpR family regulator
MTMAHAPAEPRARRVLVVDDDPDLMSLVAREFRAQDPDVCIQWSMDFEAARACLRSCRYDAVLADYLIEGAAGGWSLRSDCDVCQPGVPFALMSALPLSGTEKLGVPFLKKPFSRHELSSFLRSLLDGDGDSAG